MAIAVKYTNFAKSTGASGSSQTIAHGLGSTPKAVLLWCTRQTAFDTLGDHLIFCIGMSDGAQEYAAVARSKDNVEISKCGRRHGQKCLIIINQDGPIVAEGHVDSFDATNVTIIWDTNDANAYKIHMITFGGADLVDAKVVLFQAVQTATVQSVDVGFQAKGGIFISASTPNDPPFAGTDLAEVMIGFQGVAGTSEAKSTTFISMDNLETTDTACRWLSNRSLQFLAFKNDAIASSGQGYVSAWENDGTMDITWTEAPVAANYVGALLFNGGSYAAKDHTVGRTTDGDTAYTGYGFTPKGLFLMGFRLRNTEISIQTSARGPGFGACSGVTSTGAIAVLDNDALAISDNNQKSKNLRNFFVIASPDNDGTLASFDADGFTETWTTVFDSAQIFFTLAIGDGGANAAPLRRRRLLTKLGR